MQEILKFKQKEEGHYCMESHYSMEQQQNIKNVLKRGIYKELYERKLLSDEQLNTLLERIN